MNHQYLLGTVFEMVRQEQSMPVVKDIGPTDLGDKYLGVNLLVGDAMRSAQHNSSLGLHYVGTPEYSLAQFQPEGIRSRVEVFGVAVIAEINALS